MSPNCRLRQVVIWTALLDFRWAAMSISQSAHEDWLQHNELLCCITKGRSSHCLVINYSEEQMKTKIWDLERKHPLMLIKQTWNMFWNTTEKFRRHRVIVKCPFETEIQPDSLFVTSYEWSSCSLNFFLQYDLFFSKKSCKCQKRD